MTDLTVANDVTGIVAAFYSTALAAPWIMVTGDEYLPIGGYIGEDPSPSLATLKHLVATGRVSLFVIPVLLSPRDPRLAWVRQHCANDQVNPVGTGTEFSEYSCLPSNT